MSLKLGCVTDIVGALRSLYHSCEHEPCGLSLLTPSTCILCWRCRKWLSLYRARSAWKCTSPSRLPVLNQWLMVQGCKYCALPGLWLVQLRQDLHYLQSFPVGLSPTALQTLILGFAWHHTLTWVSLFPFVFFLFLYFPTVFSPLIHRNPHLWGTERITRCILWSMMSCSSGWPRNHNDIVIFAHARMGLFVSPTAWMNHYTFAFQWRKHLRTIWGRNVHRDCCLKIFY